MISKGQKQGAWWVLAGLALIVLAAILRSLHCENELAIFSESLHMQVGMKPLGL